MLFLWKTEEKTIDSSLFGKIKVCLYSWLPYVAYWEEKAVFVFKFWNKIYVIYTFQIYSVGISAFKSFKSVQK